ncbi:hypothetical protein, partial [Streptomyces glaucescens]|uniref:hypothetical protein n=1 Tax=Streptomyces glaucescens TaxID=1907 RepID=UPI001B80BCDE
MVGSVACGVSPAAARWDAEPWLTLRARRGPAGASAPVPAPAAAAPPAPAAAVWLAEPSPAVRVRRTGRSPAAAGRA